jgi:hypothetical protein
MPNPKGGINRHSFDGDSEGNAQRRQNLSDEAIAGSTAGPSSSTARTFDERAKYRRGVADKGLKG